MKINRVGGCNYHQNPPPPAHHNAASEQCCQCCCCCCGSRAIPQSCSSEVQGYLFTDMLLSLWRHVTKEEIIQRKRRKWAWRTEMREKRRTESRRCDIDRKRVGEGERKQHRREKKKKENTRWERGKRDTRSKSVDRKLLSFLTIVLHWRFQ